MAKRLLQSIMGRRAWDPTIDNSTRLNNTSSDDSLNKDNSAKDINNETGLPVPSRRDGECPACSPLDPLRRCLVDWNAVGTSQHDSVLYSWSYDPVRRLDPEERLPRCDMCCVVAAEIQTVDGCRILMNDIREYIGSYARLADRVEQAKESQPDLQPDEKRKSCRNLFQETALMMQTQASMSTTSQAVAGCLQVQYNYDEAALLYPGLVSPVFAEFVPFCEKIIKLMQEPLAQHPGSELCPVCESLTTPPELSNAWNCVGETRLAQILKNHPVPRRKGVRKPRLVDKVSIQLQHMGVWKGLKFQEYEHDLSATHKANAELYRASYHQASTDEALYVPFAPSRPGFARNVDSRFDAQLLADWLRRCHSDHGDRCVSKTSLPFAKNVILIDTEQDCHVRTEPGQRPSYLALSYVWGGFDQVKLTRATLAAWQQPGSLVKEPSIAPKVLDAMMVARQTGVRYLWVDALCIVQDDDTHRQEQIAQMFLVYHQAEAAIVAADGPTCGQGLSGISRFEERTRIDEICTIQGVPMARVLQEPRHVLRASQWRTRGWTFQEEICSTRCVIFLPSVVLFSCPSAAWREDLCLESMEGSPTDFGLSSLLVATARGDDTAPAGEPVTMFQRVVKQYTQRQLSRTGDIENAFAGIATMMETRAGLGPLYHGVPERHFALAIAGCWFWAMCCARRPGFPSWSWTGWSYTKDQADVGFEPSPGAAETAGLLVFFKLEGHGAEMLVNAEFKSPVLDCLQPALREHFTPNPTQAQSTCDTLLLSPDGLAEGLICFSTSCCYLKLRPQHRNAVSSVREYLVLSPQGLKLTSVYVEQEDVDASGEPQPFVVIAARRGEVGHTGLRLMLVKETGDICTKVNVTSQRKLVDEAMWWGLGPSKRLVVMG